jgi:predicted DNA-binding transcriptional regulator AlpA
LIKIENKIQKQHQANQQYNIEREVRRRARGIGLPKIKPIPFDYYTKGDVMKLAGLTQAGLYDAVREGRFPKWMATKGPAGGWNKAEVDSWLAGRKKSPKKK